MAGARETGQRECSEVARQQGLDRGEPRRQVHPLQFRGPFPVTLRIQLRGDAKAEPGGGEVGLPAPALAGAADGRAPIDFQGTGKRPGSNRPATSPSSGGGVKRGSWIAAAGATAASAKRAKRQSGNQRGSGERSAGVTGFRLALRARAPWAGARSPWRTHGLYDRWRTYPSARY